MLRSLAAQLPRVSTVASASSNHGPSINRAVAYSTSSRKEERPLNRRLEVDLSELTSLQRAAPITLIDVRQPAELTSQEQIPGSLHIPLGNLKEAFQLSEIEWQSRFNVIKPRKQDNCIIFYARGPIASSAAVEIAHKLGYKKSRHYVGGWEDYCAQKNLPLEKSRSVEDPLQQHYNYHYYNPDLHYL